MRLRIKCRKMIIDLRRLLKWLSPGRQIQRWFQPRIKEM